MSGDRLHAWSDALAEAGSQFYNKLDFGTPQAPLPPKPKTWLPPPPLLQPKVSKPTSLPGHVLDHRGWVADLPPPLDPNYAAAFSAALVAQPWYRERVDALAGGGDGAGCEGAAQLHLSQLSVHAHLQHVATLIAAGRGSEVPQGTLVYHSTGAGKTAIQMGALDAFADLIVHHGWRPLFVTTKTNAQTNTVKAMGEWAHHYPYFVTPRFQALISEAGSVAEAMVADGLIRNAQTQPKSFNWLSYIQMRDRIGGSNTANDPLHGAEKLLVVCDEAHNFTDGVGRDTNAAPRALAELAKRLRGRPIFFLLLTATPGSTAAKLAELLNLTHAAWPSRVGITADNLLAEARLGRVSYVDMRGLRAFFPHLRTETVAVAAPTGEHARRVARALKVDKKKGDLAKVQEVAHIFAACYRKACDCGADCVMGRKCSGGAGLSPSELNSGLQRLVDGVVQHEKVKQLVYVKTKKEARAFLCLARRAKGWEHILNKDLNALGLKGVVVTAWQPTSDSDEPPTLRPSVQEWLKRRAAAPAVATLDTLAPSSEDSAYEGRKKVMLELFNLAENKRGELFPVLLAWGDMYQGLDLRDTVVVHQLGEMDSDVKTKQLDGRAVRSRSLCRVKDEHWTVIKYKYVSGVDAAAAAEPAPTDNALLVWLRQEAQRLFLQAGPFREARAAYVAALESTIAADQAGVAPDFARVDAAKAVWERERAAMRADARDGTWLTPTQLVNRIQELERGGDTKDARDDPKVGSGVDPLLREHAKAQGDAVESILRALQETAFDFEALKPINI